MYTINKIAEKNICTVMFDPSSWESISVTQFVIDLEAFRKLQKPEYMLPVLKDLESLGIALKSVGRYVESPDSVIIEFDTY